jgi:hypothetical protein
LDIQLPVQSVPITTKVVSSNPVHYVIKFVSDLRQVGGFPVSSTNNTDNHDIAAILLKVALNTIDQQTDICTFSRISEMMRQKGINFLLSSIHFQLGVSLA